MTLLRILFRTFAELTKQLYAFGVFFFMSISSDYSLQVSTQPAITCSNLTMQTLEQGVKYVQRYQNDANGAILVSLLLTLNIFHTFFSSVSIVNFEQVNAE